MPAPNDEPLATTVSIWQEDRGPVVETESGLRIPSPFKATLLQHPEGTTANPPWLEASRMELVIEVVDGTPRIAAFATYRPHLDRTIDLREVLNRAVAAAAHIVSSEEGGPSLISDDTHSALMAAARGVRPRRAITDDHLREVARIATANPGRPNLAVQKALHTGPRNATRWISLAKGRGLLNTENGETDD